MIGAGSFSDPFLISTESDLNEIRNYPTSVFVLQSDIELTSQWIPIPEFSGILNGNGHLISELTVILLSTGGIDFGGLFGTISGAAVIENITIKTSATGIVAPPGPSHWSGILAGRISNNGAAGDAVRCSRVIVSGVIDSGYLSGGFVGGVYQEDHTTEDPNDLFGVATFSDCAAFAKNIGHPSSSDNFHAPFIGYLFNGLCSFSRCYSSQRLYYDSMDPPLASADENVAFGRIGDSIGTSKNLTVSQISDINSYPTWDFVDIYEMDPSGVPRVRPGQSYSGGDGSQESARIAGTVKIDGIAAARDVIVISDDPSGRQVVGEGESAEDGSFDIIYTGWTGSVIALALDNYGQAWESSANLSAGTVVHPTTPNGYVYRVTSAGTTGTEEPTWSTEGGLADGSVTYEAKPYYRPVASGPLEGEPTEVVEAYPLWRVYMHSTDNIYRLEVMDLEFYDADHVQIPTTGGVADALASSNLDYGPEYAFDGDRGTHWVGDFEAIPNWLSYELTDPAMAAFVRIIPRTLNRAPTDLSLEYSEDNGQTWVEVGRWQTTWPDDTPQEFTTL